MSVLAEGQVEIIKTTIFELVGNDVLNTNQAKIEKITMFNTSAVAQTVSLFINSIQLRQFILQQNEGGEYLEPGEFLLIEASDVIEAQTTTELTVDFVVFGEFV